MIAQKRTGSPLGHSVEGGETGGIEKIAHCGAVIQRALSDLTWDTNPKTYKAIFIAGNEPFTQGPVEPRQVCREGYSKGIIINTIHCGSRDAGVSGSWNDGAALGGGKFLIIDQDRADYHIDKPQDKKISDLGIELNKKTAKNSCPIIKAC